MTSQGAGHGDFDLMTLASEADAYAHRASLRVTNTQRDALGNAVVVAQPARTGVNGSPSLFTPVVNQVFDRWGNLVSASDPRNAAWITRYAYDAGDQLIELKLPDASSGADSSTSTKYYYDRLGHRVATRDEDGNVFGQRFDAAGELIQTDQHPSDAVLVKTTNAYDIFGRKVSSVSGDGYTKGGSAVSNIADYTTTYTYDALDHLLAQTQGITAGNNVAIVQEYGYDADGNRLTQWNGALMPDYSKAITTYAYDAADHLVKTTLPTWLGTTPVTRYVYDDFGNLASETDANGDPAATWQRDYFGRQLTGTGVKSHHDYAGVGYQYTYDHAGQLVTQASDGGQNLAYAYDEAGEQTKIQDNSANGLGGTLNETTACVFDAAGNHVKETTTLGSVSVQANTLTYDKRGRLTDSSDDQATVHTDYDAVGNRMHVHVTLNEDATERTPGAPASVDLQHYYQYDGMNRQVHVDWQSDTVQGVHGHLLSYDADGNRLSDTYTSNLITATGAATLSGETVDGKAIFTGFTTPTYDLVGGTVTQRYSYDAQDRLSRTLYSVNDINGGPAVAGWVVIDQRGYDSAGRLASEGATLPGAGKRTGTNGNSAAFLQWLNTVDQSLNEFGVGLASDQTTWHSYDSDGRLMHVGRNDSSSSYSVDYTHDADGNVTFSVLKTQYGVGPAYATLQHGSVDETTFTIQAGESDRTTAQASVQQTWRQVDTGSGSGTPYDDNVRQPFVAAYDPIQQRGTTSSYDADGNVTQVLNDTLPKQVYVNDAQGRVLRNNSVDNQGNTTTLRNVVVGGQTIGRYGVDPSERELGNEQAAIFEFGFASMEDSATETGASMSTAHEGETLQQAAQAAYGDSQYWRRLAAANGLRGDERLHEGQRLVMAGASGTMHNDADTVSIDDTGAMLGNTAPGIVTQDPVMSGVERDNYFKDVYNRQAPVPYDRHVGNMNEAISTVNASNEAGGGAGETVLTITGTNGNVSTLILEGVSVNSNMGISYGSSTGTMLSGGGSGGTPAFEGTTWNFAAAPQSSAPSNFDMGAIQGSFGDRNTTSVGDLWSGGGGWSIQAQGAEIGSAGGSVAIGADPSDFAELDAVQSDARDQWGMSFSENVKFRAQLRSQGIDPDFNPAAQTDYRNGADIASDRRRIVIGADQGLLAAASDTFGKDGYAAYGSLARSGALQFNSLNSPVVHAGDTLIVDSIDFRSSDDALGRALTSNETATRGYALALAERQNAISAASIGSCPIVTTTQQTQYTLARLASVPQSVPYEPSALGMIAGDAEVAELSVWNGFLVQPLAGLIGIGAQIDTALGFLPEGSATKAIQAVQSGLTAKPYSANGEWAQYWFETSGFVQGLQAVRQQTGDYYADRDGPIAGAAGAAAPDALLMLLPGAPKAFKNFGFAMLDNMSVGAASGSMRAQRGSIDPAFLTGQWVGDGVSQLQTGEIEGNAGVASLAGAVEGGSPSTIGNVASDAVGKVPVQLYDVMTYGESKAGAVVGDELTGDHIPSYAAIRQNVETTLGRELTADEARALRDNTNVVIVGQDLHAAGRTYFGANTPAQIAGDSLNLSGAGSLDQAVHLGNAPGMGYSPVSLEASFERLNQMNRQTFNLLSTEQSITDFFTNLGVY